MLAYAASALAERPMTGTQLRAVLAERFPGLDAAALAFACRNHLTLVQVPPRGLWSRSGQVTTTTAESWLGRALAVPMSIDDLVLRYLAAFGPALPADAAAWSRLTAMGEVFERLRPRLVTFRDRSGRVLFDLPDAPRPDPDTPAPVRFLPEYDNVLLSHADRSRFLGGRGAAELSAAPTPVKGTVLADGRGLGGWRLDRDRRVAVGHDGDPDDRRRRPRHPRRCGGRGGPPGGVHGARRRGARRRDHPRLTHLVTHVLDIENVGDQIDERDGE